MLQQSTYHLHPRSHFPTFAFPTRCRIEQKIRLQSKPLRLPRIRRQHQGRRAITGLHFRQRVLPVVSRKVSVTQPWSTDRSKHHSMIPRALRCLSQQEVLACCSNQESVDGRLAQIVIAKNRRVSPETRPGNHPHPLHQRDQRHMPTPRQKINPTINLDQLGHRRLKQSQIPELFVANHQTAQGPTAKGRSFRLSHIGGYHRRPCP